MKKTRRKKSIRKRTENYLQYLTFASSAVDELSPSI